ncbi:MAG: hypothetical protein ACHQIM_02805 [Sphingobacteriales bacterium]|jgi:hypothetical protein
METITLDLLDDNALNLLKDMEARKIIRIQDNKEKPKALKTNLAAKYSGAMAKQSLEDINKQLKELRDEWD